MSTSLRSFLDEISFFDDGYPKIQSIEIWSVKGNTNDLLSESDFVVVCTPVRHIETILTELALIVCDGSLVTDVAYDHIKTAMLDRLKASSIDGVALALHGSSASESIGDLVDIPAGGDARDVIVELEEVFHLD